MKINIKKIEKQGKRLILYAKKPLFISYHNFANELSRYFRDSDNLLEIRPDETGKYVIITFVLRNKEDILPYIKKGSGVN